MSPIPNIWDVPVKYLFATLFAEVIEETEEKIIMEIRSSEEEGQVITRQTNFKLGPESWDSKTEAFQGKIRLEAYK